ncbi:protein-tyrosine-phosphatase [Algoriphagus aestuarii]|nr:protein-tyrosine-phosphatase [Algoriphagus aestuarii]
MKDKPNVLVVCGRNKRRSRTAEYIFKNDARFNIRSVGLSPKSERQIKEVDVRWSDLIFVMEYSQSKRISEAFRNEKLPEIEVLLIDDDYEYLNEELVEMLLDRINTVLKSVFGI